MNFIGLQIFSLIITSGLVGAWGMYQWCLAASWIESKRTKRHREEWEADRQRKITSRARWLKEWASKKMDTIPNPKLKTLDRKVLVTYEELLWVWDRSDKIIEEI